jgi:hypothetical protein
MMNGNGRPFAGIGASAVVRRETRGTRSPERRVVMVESLSCARRLSRDRMPPFPHRAAGPQGATARPRQAAGRSRWVSAPARGGEIGSPAAPLLLRNTPRRKGGASMFRGNAAASVGL